MIRTPDERSRRLPALDGWRAIAIAMVVAVHAGRGNPILEYGNYGVEVFFAISGLLITKLLLQEFDSTGSISLQAFYIRRAFRILPLVIVFLIFVGMLGWFLGPLEWISSLFFFRDFIALDIQASYYTAHFWSLAIEEHFYLIWPVLLVLAVRRNAARAWTVAAVAVATAFFYIEAYSLVPVLGPAGLETHMGDIMWGAGAAVALHYYGEWVKRNFSLLVFWLCVFLYIGAITFTIRIPAIFRGSLLAAIVLGPVCRPDWFVTKFLELGVMRWIGRISYSLYIWQQIFLVPDRYVHHWTLLQRFPQNVLMAVGVAAASYYILEKPLMTLGRRVAARIAVTVKPGAAPPLPALVPAQENPRA
jgi:peptidoglycan/LPS O-acetylase OafA/YrhL